MILFGIKFKHTNHVAGRHCIHHLRLRVFDSRPIVRIVAWAISASSLTLAGCSVGAGSGGSGSADSGTATVTVTHASTAATDSPAGAVMEAPGIGRSSGMSTASMAAVAHTNDADRDFLHHMLDHYEAVLRIVHDDMMKTEGHDMHGSGADPVEHDAALDAEKQQMLMLLKTLYGEQYSPQPVAAKAAAVTGKIRLQESLATHFRAGIALVDRSLRGIERRDVRALAIKVRATQRARLKAMGEGPAGTH